MSRDGARIRRRVSFKARYLKNVKVGSSSSKALVGLLGNYVGEKRGTSKIHEIVLYFNNIASKNERGIPLTKDEKIFDSKINGEEFRDWYEKLYKVLHNEKVRRGSIRDKIIPLMNIVIQDVSNDKEIDNDNDNDIENIRYENRINNRFIKNNDEEDVKQYDLIKKPVRSFHSLEDEIRKESIRRAVYLQDQEQIRRVNEAKNLRVECEKESEELRAKSIRLVQLIQDRETQRVFNEQEIAKKESEQDRLKAIKIAKELIDKEQDLRVQEWEASRKVRFSPESSVVKFVPDEPIVKEESYNTLPFLLSGSCMFKYSDRKEPHLVWGQLSRDCTTFTTFSKKKKTVYPIIGLEVTNHCKLAPRNCFSITHTEPGKPVTDSKLRTKFTEFRCIDSSEFTIWFESLKQLVAITKDASGHVDEKSFVELEALPQINIHTNQLKFQEDDQQDLWRTLLKSKGEQEGFKMENYDFILLKKQLKVFSYNHDKLKKTIDKHLNKLLDTIAKLQKHEKKRTEKRKKKAKKVSNPSLVTSASFLQTINRLSHLVLMALNYIELEQLEKSAVTGFECENIITAFGYYDKHVKV